MTYRRSLTENYDLVGSGKSEACPTGQRRNEENKDVCLGLKFIDQGHACAKRQSIMHHDDDRLRVLTIFLFR
jgi:hypothetical protein